MVANRLYGIVTAVVLGGVGCAGGLKEQTQRDREVLLDRAEVDLSCPRVSLQATATRHKRYPDGDFPTRYRVEGCGRAQTYLWRDLEQWATVEEGVEPVDHARSSWPGARTPVPPEAGGAVPR